MKELSRKMLKTILICAVVMLGAAQSQDQLEVKEISAKDVKALQQASASVEDATRMLREAQGYLAEQKRKAAALRADVLQHAGVTEHTDPTPDCFYAGQLYQPRRSADSKSTTAEIRGKYILITTATLSCTSSASSGFLLNAGPAWNVTPSQSKQ